MTQPSDAAALAAAFFKTYPPPDAQWYVDEVLIPALTAAIAQAQREVAEGLMAENGRLKQRVRALEEEQDRLYTDVETLERELMRRVTRRS